jgi:excisionase family DNA binding protein
LSAPTVAPAAYTVKQFCATYGVGRTFTYAEVKAGRLRLVKAGNRTLIGAAEAQRWFDSLPAARQSQAA